jgi:c-di-GMP-binding flagellar brake protein YcgR
MAADVSSQERRQTPRAESSPPLEVKVEVGGRTIPGVALDVSQGGMLLDTQSAAPPDDTELHVKFRLPGRKQRITARAEVVRQAGASRFGVRFLMLGSEELAALDAFVKSSKG